MSIGKSFPGCPNLNIFHKLTCNLQKNGRKLINKKLKPLLDQGWKSSLIEHIPCNTNILVFSISLPYPGQANLES